VQICNRDNANRKPPSAPVGLVVKAGERHFDLMWSNNPESDLLKYQIYRSWMVKNMFPSASSRASLIASWTLWASLAGKHSIGSVRRIWRERIPAVTARLGLHPVVQRRRTVGHGSGSLFPILLGGGTSQCRPWPSKFCPAMQTLLRWGIRLRSNGFDRRNRTAFHHSRTVRGTPDQNHTLSAHGGSFPWRLAAFPRWSYGPSMPYFGKYDNGGDLVETAFLIEGLLSARQYFNRDTPAEREIRQNITDLWRGVEWDWYRKEPASEFLFWHWSPDFGWHISHPLVGWNET